MSETARRALSSFAEQVRDLWFLAALLVAIGVGVARLNLRLDAIGQHYHAVPVAPPCETGPPRVPLDALGRAEAPTPGPDSAGTSWLASQSVAILPPDEP